MIERFEIRDVLWLVKQSPNIGEDDLNVVGIRSLDVTCKDCSSEWRATAGFGRGHFDGGAGAIGLRCVKCENKETIATRELSKKFPYER